MAQALFHSDEEVWQEWNTKNTRYLSAIASFPSTKNDVPPASFSLSYGHAPRIIG